MSRSTGAMKLVLAVFLTASAATGLVLLSRDIAKEANVSRPRPAKADGARRGVGSSIQPTPDVGRTDSTEEPPLPKPLDGPPRQTTLTESKLRGLSNAEICQLCEAHTLLPEEEELIAVFLRKRMQEMGDQDLIEAIRKREHPAILQMCLEELPTRRDRLPPKAPTIMGGWNRVLTCRDEALPVLREVVADEHVDAGERLYAAEILASQGDGSGAELAEVLVKSDDWRTRAAAYHVLPYTFSLAGMQALIAGEPDSRLRMQSTGWLQPFVDGPQVFDDVYGAVRKAHGSEKVK